MGPEAGHFRPPRLMAATHHRHGSRTLPQRPCAHADPTTPAGEDEFFGRLLPHPSTAFPLWKEGRLQRETIEACSGFTCFSACALAPWFRQGLPRRLQPDDLSNSAAPVATGRIDNSPDGTFTRWPSRPRRSLRNLKLRSRQTSFRAALPPEYRECLLPPGVGGEDRFRAGIDAWYYQR